MFFSYSLALVFVYDYHPNAENVLHRHFMETTNSLPNMKNGTVGAHPPPPAGRKGFSASNSQSRQHLMPERLIWNYVIQLSSALRSIHSVMLACRVIDPSKILILSKSRYSITFLTLFGNLLPNIERRPSMHLWLLNFRTIPLQKQYFGLFLLY